MTSLDDVIDQKSKNIWNLWVTTFLLMYHTTIFVKLLLLKSTKTVKFSNFSLMTSRDDVIDQKCFHIRNLWNHTFHLMYHMAMSDHQKGISKFGPSFDPSLWRHRGSQWGQWRHQSKDRQKVIKHGKFRKILCSRFYGSQKDPIYCLAEKKRPPGKNDIRTCGWKKGSKFFSLEFHFIQFKKKDFSYPVAAPKGTRPALQMKNLSFLNWIKWNSKRN